MPDIHTRNNSRMPELTNYPPCTLQIKTSSPSHKAYLHAGRGVATGKCGAVRHSQLLELEKIQVKMGHYIAKIRQFFDELKAT